MSAARHLNAQQFSRTSLAELHPGQMLTAEGARTAEPQHASAHACFCDSRERAQVYRDQVLGPKARIYQVEPTGHHEQDPGSALSDHRSAHPVRVIRELDREAAQ